MFYPPQTSFIPVTVALSRFFERGDIWGNYPYWYLGSTPFRYLTGPVMPAILAFLHKIMPGFSLFDLSYFVIFISVFVSTIGWGIFSAKLSDQRQIGFLVGIISFIMPWHWISALALSDVSAVLAQALTPWVLLGFRVQGLGHREGLVTSLYTLVPIFAFALLLLTNPVASIPAILGLIILGYFGDKKWGVGLKKAAMVVFLGWLLTLWWFTPGYWLTLFAAPSIGGRSAVGAFWSLVGFLRMLVPVALAFAVVFWAFEKRDKFTKFAVLWLCVFGIFTIFRFLADPKFWMDWTSWVGEVEVGVALLASMLIFRSVRRLKKRSTEVSSDHISHNSVSLRPSLAYNSDIKSNVKPSARFVMFLKWLPSLNFDRKFAIFYFLRPAAKARTAWLCIFTTYIFFAWLFAFQHRSFWLPTKSIEDRVEYKIGKELEAETENWKLKTEKDPVVFLSGSSAFWLNSFFDIRQVRGGVDQGSVNKVWRQVVWEVRGGASTDGSYEALKRLKVGYLVVHGENSREYYHDFESPGKFEQNPLFEKIYEADGDVIYRVE